jgi:hypothetical protein
MHTYFALKNSKDEFVCAEYDGSDPWLGKGLDRVHFFTDQEEAKSYYVRLVKTAELNANSLFNLKVRDRYKEQLESFRDCKVVKVTMTIEPLE